MIAVVSAVGGFVALFALFGVLEALFPDKPRQRRWRSGTRTDAIWFFAGYVSRPIGAVATVIGVVVLARLIPHPVIPAVSAQPAWVQLIEVMLLADVVQYWVHRWFHGKRLWRFHSVHHSIEEVDWLAAARVHPVDTIVHRPLEVVPMFMLGFSSLNVLPLYALIIAIYPIYLHANLRWSYGPLRWLIASPTFHRWHHTAEAGGVDKNFAALFPFLDILFGTYHMPERRSASFGLGTGQHMSTSFAAQLLHPLRSAISQT